MLNTKDEQADQQTRLINSDLYLYIQLIFGKAIKPNQWKKGIIFQYKVLKLVIYVGKNYPKTKSEIINILENNMINTFAILEFKF